MFKLRDTLTYKLVRLLAKPIIKVLYRYEIHNKNNLPKEGRFIVCPNHLSLVDCAFIVISQKRPIHFMAKEELFENKFLAFLLKALGVFPVSRGRGDMKAMNTANDILENGGVLGIFIEGTRSKDGNLLQPKAGVALIAHKTQTPVLPICITPKNGGKIKIFKKVIITCGEPISVDELGIVDGKGSEMRNAARLIMNRISEMREQDLCR